MLGKKKVKIAFLFTSGMSLILILLTIAFSVTSIRSVRKLGNFAVKIDEDNIQKISSNLFLEITRRTAEQYSTYFRSAEQTTKTIATQLSKVTLSPNNLQNIKLNDVILNKYKDRDYFIEDPSSLFTAFYWGNETEVPIEVKKKIAAIASLTPVMKNIIKFSSGYYHTLWIHGKDKFMYTYPKIDFYGKVLNRNAIEGYFKKFNIFSKYGNGENYNRSIWRRAYKDITGHIILTIHSPVYDENDNVEAVVGLDMNLGMFLDNMLSSRLLVSGVEKTAYDKGKRNYIFEGFLFIVGSDSTLIAFPPKYAELFSLPPGYDELSHFSQEIVTKMSDSSDPQVKKIAMCMIKHPNDVDIVNLKGEKYVIAHSKLPSTGWTLGFAISERCLMRLAAKTKLEMGNTEIDLIKYTFVIAVCFLVASIILAVFLFRRFLFIPMERFKKQIRELVNGNFEYKVKEDDGIAEMDQLAKTFNYLGTELSKYTKNLKQEIEARHKIETEVRIAGDIQRSFLPKVTEEFKRKEFCLFALLSSAKEASGDFYDFFFLNEKKVAFLIADVSGKGLSAAFFMGMVKTVLKNICLQEKNDPANSLNRVNRILSQDNSSLMFVTLFLAYYDIETGELIYSNAGHHDVIRITKEGTFKNFGVMKGIALGITDSRKYESKKIQISIGDTLVLYTDGVVEAVNPEGEIYGDERFQKFVYKNRNLLCEEIAGKSIKEIRDFEKRKRFDDVTLLVFRRHE